MAPHSSTLAWKIPGTGEPGELPSMGSHRVGHDLGDLVAAAAQLKKGGGRIKGIDSSHKTSFIYFKNFLAAPCGM